MLLSHRDMQYFWRTLVFTLLVSLFAACDQGNGEPISQAPRPPEPTTPPSAGSLAITVNSACSELGPITAVSISVAPDGAQQELTPDAETGTFGGEIEVTPGEKRIVVAARVASVEVGNREATLIVKAGERLAAEITDLLGGAIPADDPECLSLRIPRAISRALDYLKPAQLSWGEFRAPMCDDYWVSVNCLAQSSPFATTFVLYALTQIDDPRSAEMQSKAIAFLDSEEKPGGWWPFWSSRSGIYIPGDVDTTATVSFAIAQSGRTVDNINLLMGNRTTDTGVFLSWFPEYATYGENDVDCVVNANALLYVGEVPEVCTYLNDVFTTGAQCSKYYPADLELAYSASRALREGNDCLQPSGDEMTAIALARLASPQPSALELALAYDTLQNVGYSGPEVYPALAHLLDLQSADGSWPEEAFWCIDCGRNNIQYFGSRELTTGFALEALSRFVP